MKIAHTSANSNSGLAHVARDEVMAERRLGVDARIVYPEEHTFLPVFTGTGSEGVVVGSIDWARDEADVIVSHSGLGGGEEEWEKPCLVVAHGNPYHSFEMERAGHGTAYSIMASKGSRRFCHKVVTYWEIDAQYWRNILPEGMVTVVPLSVNLEKWTTGPPEPEFFRARLGDINVLSTGRYRATCDPFPVWNAFNVFADKFPEKNVRLHICGLEADFSATGPIFNALHYRERIGDIIVSATADELRSMYRTADMCIVAHHTESLTLREAMACGCPVVGDRPLKTTPYTAPVHDANMYADAMKRAYDDGQRLGRDGIARATRADAEKHFQPEATAKAFIALCEEAIAAKGVAAC